MTIAFNLSRKIYLKKVHLITLSHYFILLKRMKTFYIEFSEAGCIDELSSLIKVSH
jgi:hypothetical protein